MMLLNNEIILFQILYIIGITAESMSGTISAVRKNMDIFGITSIAIITALGGGTIRDVLLGHYPLIWILHPIYIAITFIASIFAMLLFHKIVKLRNLFLILDALGLVTFAYLGSGIGYKVAINILHSSMQDILGCISIGVIMAIITGVSGGILRDILCNDIPLVFRTELYATVAGVVGILHTISMYCLIDNLVTAILIILIGLTIRLFAIFKNYKLPKIKYYI
jgi:uncharacterized membrane protein YeiH